MNVSTIYELINGNEDDEIDLLTVLDAPTDAHSMHDRGWLSGPPLSRTDIHISTYAALSFTSSPSGSSQSSSDGGSTRQGLGMLEEKMNKGIRYACQAMLVPGPDMPRFVTIVGDGDCR